MFSCMSSFDHGVSTCPVLPLFGHAYPNLYNATHDERLVLADQAKTAGDGGVLAGDGEGRMKNLCGSPITFRSIITDKRQSARDNTLTTANIKGGNIPLIVPVRRAHPPPFVLLFYTPKYALPVSLSDADLLQAGNIDSLQRIPPAPSSQADSRRSSRRDSLRKLLDDGGVCGPTPTPPAPACLPSPASVGRFRTAAAPAASFLGLLVGGRSSVGVW